MNNKINWILGALLVLVSIAYFGTANNQGGILGRFGDDQFGQSASFTATTTAVGTASGVLLTRNFEASFRQVCIHPDHFASSTAYLHLASSTTAVVGGGVVLSSSTQTCVTFDSTRPYFDTIKAVASAATVLVVAEY